MGEGAGGAPGLKNGFSTAALLLLAVLGRACVS